MAFCLSRASLGRRGVPKFAQKTDQNAHFEKPIFQYLTPLGTLLGAVLADLVQFWTLKEDPTFSYKLKKEVRFRVPFLNLLQEVSEPTFERLSALWGGVGQGSARDFRSRGP